MPETGFPRVKLERTDALKKLVAATGGESGHSLFKTGAWGRLCKPATSLCWMTATHTFETLGMARPSSLMNGGVHTMDMWVCFHATGPVVSSRGQCMCAISELV